jgi:hypothetical protein
MMNETPFRNKFLHYEALLWEILMPFPFFIPEVLK